MATVNTTWTSPASATLDKATGATIDETMTDAWSSDLYHLGGTVGYIGARAYNSANLSISNGTLTALTLNSGRYDSDPNGTIHSTSVNTSRFTCRTTGVYHLGASVEFAANSTGVRIVQLQVNGTTVVAQDERNALSGGDPHRTTISTTYNLTATDYVECIVYQTSGGALNVTAASAYSPEVWVTKA